jgi:hypothetical protein
MKLALTLPRSLIISSFLCVAIYAGLHIPHLQAAETPEVAVGQVIWTKGIVQAQQPGQAPRTLQRRSVIYEHDTITTDKDGSGELSFVDNGVMSLNPESEFRVDEYKYKKDSPADDKSVMTLVKGGFRTITGTIPKVNPDAYKIHTPVATIGVRGTQYATVFSPTKGLFLQIEKGIIDVTNGAGKIELSKCDTGGGSNNCNQYAIVKSFNIVPTTTTVRPPELANVVQVSAVPAGFGAPGSAPTKATPSTSSAPAISSSPAPAGTSTAAPDELPSAAPAAPKTVSNFCVGLLKDIYERFNKLFG